MRKLISALALLCAIAFIAATAPAQAANTRSWVSASGSNGNACTQSAPCLTFAFAITQTNAGGEIDCLSGGDFGAVTITFSITIDCGTGQVGTINSYSSTAITINTSSPSVVVLRNLNLGGNGNFSGIVTTNFANSTLTVQHCTIYGQDSGISFMPTSGRGSLQIIDTSVYGNQVGVDVEVASGVIASVVLNQVELNGNRSGLNFGGSGTVAGTLRQSVVAANSAYGISANVAASYFTVEESSIVDNLTSGISTTTSGTNVEVAASTIGANGTGLSAGSGNLYSFGNNQLSANGSNGSFTPGGPGLH
jgi:hypothetical protein